VTIQFCAKAGCHDVAVGVSRWDRDAPAGPPLCRPHRLADLQTVRCEVIGPLAVTDVRTQEGVTRGGVVELDPAEANIAQLVYAGHVRVIATPKAEARDTVDEVLAWVGDDRERASVALQTEMARDRPRAGVTAPLEKLLAESQQG